MCLRESLRETQFSPNAMNQYGLAQDRRFPNEIVEKGSCAKQTCVVTTKVKATEIGLDLSHCGVPWLDAIAGCHCWMLATNFGGVHVGCHCWVAIAGGHAGVPLRGKIDQSVTPFSAAPFSTLTTHKLACAI